MKDEIFFKLYGNCILVSGAKRGIICDLFRERYLHIPNILIDIIEELKTTPLQDYLENLDKESRTILNEYVSMLLDKDFGLLTSNPENFPEISFKSEFPFKITNAIFDFDCFSNFNLYHYSRLLNDLSIFNCQAIEIRFFDVPDPEFLIKLIELIDKTRVRHVNILMKFSSSCDSFIKKITSRFKVVVFIQIFDASSNHEAVINGTSVNYYKTEKLDESMCGSICTNNFVVSMNHFVESKNYNTCLNQKISVDKRGYIKNCPSSKERFGHISETDLKSVIINPNFKKLWTIKKDDIEICKVCEYRYICMDCRVFTENESSYSKPSKCTYNPYTNEWSC